MGRLLNQRRQPLFSMKQQEEIVRRFKALRGRHNLSQGRLAEAVGVTRMTIFNIEKMRHEPSLRTIHKFKELEQRYRAVSEIVSEVDFPEFKQRVIEELERRQVDA